MKNKFCAVGASGVIAVLITCVPLRTAQATTIEGFETLTLNASNSIGDASIRTPSYFGINPTEGTHELLLTTISTVMSHDPGPNQSGTNAVSVGAIAGFLGISSMTIRDGIVTGQEGSAFTLSLGTLNAGDVVSFNYDFLTNEIQPNAHNDFAFIALSGQSGNTPVVADTFSTLAVTSGAGNPFSLETHYQTYSFTISTAGIYTLGIGVVDGTTTDTSSALLIDNISVVSAVPEPSTIGLGLAGAILLVALRRRLGKTSS